MYIMISNERSVNFFSSNIGARRYCSTTVKSCLSLPGFSDELLGPIIKNFDFSSLKESF